MTGQDAGGRVIPENQVVGDKTDSSQTNQNPPRPGQDDFNEGHTEPNVAGQSADQLTDADRERLKGNQ
jgi:hypothetical protein